VVWCPLCQPRIDERSLVKSRQKSHTFALLLTLYPITIVRPAFWTLFPRHHTSIFDVGLWWASTARFYECRAYITPGWG
jgi:hypothetical protein